MTTTTLPQAAQTAIHHLSATGNTWPYGLGIAAGLALIALSFWADRKLA